MSHFVIFFVIITITLSRAYSLQSNQFNIQPSIRRDHASIAVSTYNSRSAIACVVQCKLTSSCAYVNIGEQSGNGVQCDMQGRITSGERPDYVTDEMSVFLGNIITYFILL